MGDTNGEKIMKNLQPIQNPRGDSPSYFNVKYGKASVSLTGTSALIIATTGGAFHGIGCITTTGEACTVIVYDSTSAPSGNILGMMTISSATGTQWDLNTPTMAKYGLVAVKSGTLSKATVFFGPKG